MRNTTTLNYNDFDQLIREARLQRSAALAQAIVAAATAIGNAVKSAFGVTAPNSTLPKQPALKRSLANGRPR